MLIKFIRALRYRLNLTEDMAEHSEIIAGIKKSVEFKGTNLWTLVFAIFIASIGLDVNSTAVIIGAMLISPLMGPIMGVGLGAGIQDFQLIKKSAKNLLIASTIALATSSTYFLISPLHQAQSELLARTSPTLWDVLIAFIGGAAGMVASSRKQFNNIIPGVAIATALMPPLCTAGFGLANGEPVFFFGALYLYIINSVFIGTATFLVVRYLKITRDIAKDSVIEKNIRRWVGIISFLTLVPSVYLAYRFLQQEIFETRAERFIEQEVSAQNLILLNKSIHPNQKRISLRLLNHLNFDSLQKHLSSRLDVYKISEAALEISSFQSDADALDKKERSRLIVIEELFESMNRKVSGMQAVLDQSMQLNRKMSRFEETRQTCLREFESLFGKTGKIGLNFIEMQDKSGKSDSILVMHIIGSSAAQRAERKRMESWLKSKFETEQVEISFKP